MATNDFRLVILEPKTDSHTALYSECYSFWKTIWSQTLKELVQVEKVYSDAFMSSHKVVALFNKFECIGIGLLHTYDLNNPCHLDHSYFKAFSSKSIQFFKSNFLKIASINHIAIHPDFRKSNGPSVLIETIYKEFLKTDSEALVAYTRNNRKINDIAYQLGAYSIDRDILNHGVSTDIVFFDRENFNFGDQNEKLKTA